MPPDGPTAELLPGFVASGTCSASPGACENNSTVPCTLHCATRANGCEVSSEFVPLGTVDSNYYFRFGAMDPAGKWVFYSRNWGGSAYEYTPYRWSAADGVVLLSEALGVPPTTENDESLVVLEVAARGAAILLQRVEPVEGYVWTRDAGLATLDFEPKDISADGRVVAGLRGNDAVLWDRERGTRAIVSAPHEDTTALDAGVPPLGNAEIGEATASDAGVPPFAATGVRLSDTGEFALVHGQGGRAFRWNEAQGAVPIEALPGFPRGARVTLADPNGRVLWASVGDSFRGPRRLWRWTEDEGALALGTLPLLPSDASYDASMSLNGSQVLVGKVTPTPPGELVTFRWSREVGMQQIGNSAKSADYYPSYANSDGTTVVGYAIGNDNSVNSYRWTARDGLTELAGDVRGRISLGGDLLLASVWDGTESRTQVLKFDSALDNGGALPIDIIEAGLAPEGYEHISIQAMSDNGRLLAGTVQDGEGRTHGWLLRLRDSCSL